MIEDEWPLVSVLFVTYNRPHTLVATYETFLVTTDYPRDRLELVVTDDGSEPRALDVIRELDFEVRCLAARNQGLGANINKGMRACSGEFILLMQDDWMCMRRGSYLRDAVKVLRHHPDIGIVILQDWGDSLTAERRDAEDVTLRVLAPRSPDGLIAKRTYTDNPHLKRREFHDVVGWYMEGAPMTAMENDMTRRVAAQTRFKSSLVDGENPFVHIGDRYSFNPGRRNAWIERWLASAPPGRGALGLIRRLRRAWRQWRGQEGM